MDLKRGIDKAVQAIVTDLAKQSKLWVQTQTKSNKSPLFQLIMTK
jgi:uncharacterized protein YajQ (UPF0234 family)